MYCIDGASGGVKEKKLAAQIIVKFFKYFPEHQIKALNAIIDLCESDDDNYSVSKCMRVILIRIYFVNNIIF